MICPHLEEKLVEFTKTTRVVSAGRQFSFRASVLVGNKNGFVGIGSAKDRERFPAIKKAARRAKLNLVPVHRGCGSWECPCGLPHSVPFKVQGKCASVKVVARPAPKGLGLVVGENIKNVFRFAGISDVWTETRGSSDTTLNFVKAAVDALSKTAKMRLSNDIKKKLERLQ
jgi:small subunit ribosomal protein S5